MAPQSKTMLQVPQGTEGFYFNEAYIHNQVTQAINTIFHSWGYLPVETPVFDFYDIYHNTMDKMSRDRTYRLVDREGDLLMLRSDVTLFLAKQLGLALDKSKLPTRICYSDTILRHEHTEDISRNEFFQIGAELVGKGSVEEELEIILLLIAVLELLQIDVYIHIGSRKIFEACFSSFNNETREILRQSLLSRKFEKISEILRSRGYPSWQHVVNLLEFIGSPQEFQTLITHLQNKKLVHQPVLQEIVSLNTICATLETLRKNDKIRIDLSEIGTQNYHTGTAFQVYMEGIDSSIATGGRYDGLLRQFGIDCPSVGFSILLRKIEPFLHNHQKLGIGDNIIKVDETDFVKAYKKAQQLRQKGKTVIL